MEMQLAMRNFILVIGIILITFSCKITEGDVLPKIELASTTSAAPTGSSVTKVIGTTGGTLDLPVAGLKVTVPAGAMAAGAILSLTPIKDVLDNEGTGTRISGAWTKPISLEIQISDTDIANYRLYAKMPNGLWVGAISPKVSGNKMLVRLGPNAGTNIKNGKVAAKEYDLAYAKDFYIKPDQAALELGKSQQFTAYAKAGKVPSKYKGSDGKWHSALDEDVVPLAKGTWDDDEVVPLAPSSSTADDDVVPLAPSKSLDDDEVVPLAVHVKEYAFISKKKGFNRSWTLSQPLGSVSSTGKYTAPSDESSRGKSTKVIFTSTNTKTGQKVTMESIVFINDGLQRYKGTLRIKSVKLFKSTGNSVRTTTEELKGDITLVNSVGVPWSFKHEANPKSTIKTTVENYNEVTNDGRVSITFIGDNSKPSDGGLFYLKFSKDYKTYKMSGSLDGLCSVKVFCDYCSPKNSEDNERFSSSDMHLYSSGNEPIENVDDIKSIVGRMVSTSKNSNIELTITSEWNFKKL